MSAKKVVLGFSGGLDTTYCVKWLQDRGWQPICVTVDVGQDIDIDKASRRAKELDVADHVIVDARADFADFFIAPALKANALYQRVYPLSTALSRPLISKVMADVAKQHGTATFAHGCTGKGNDQVRFELALRTLVPDAEILDPIVNENLSRDEEIEFLESLGIRTEITQEKPYSVDQNLWGRSVCAGVIEDIGRPPPEDAYSWTTSIEGAKDLSEEITLTFTSGLPTELDGRPVSVCELVEDLNVRAGRHGIGRIDHIEDRLVGIKSREVYEVPAATVLLAAHKSLESLTMTRSALTFKNQVEHEYANLIYLGDWFSQHHLDLLAYIESSQRSVSGRISLKLYKGNCTIVSRSSEQSLYQPNLATYSSASVFDQRLGTGFRRLLALEKTIAAQKQLFGSREKDRLFEAAGGQHRAIMKRGTS